MAQSMTHYEPDADGTEMSAEDVAAALKSGNTAEELRRMAAHLSDVSRPRGATKAETAEAIAEQAPEKAATIAAGGRFKVKCSCGLEYSVAHPQEARRDAKTHKAENITHFPSAVDTEDDSRLYG